MTDRLIGIDFGLSKVGLSISDPLKIISIPLKVIKYKKREELLSKLQEIAMENDVKSFVIGYPLNMNNKKNEMTKLVDDFFEELKNLNFNVFLQDERLSSESAGGSQRCGCAGDFQTPRRPVIERPARTTLDRTAG